MACTLYREGKGTVEHGIECESVTVEVHHMQGMLDQGWRTDPPGYEPPQPVVIEEDPAEAAEGSEPSEVELLLSAEVERLKGEVKDLTDELDIQRQIEDNLNAQVSRLNKLVKELEGANKAAGTDSQNKPPQDGQAAEDEQGEDESSEEINPTRAAGRDAGIEGWETMHLSTLKKALKGLEA